MVKWISFFLANCRFCNASHWSDECKKYDTTEKRKQKIKGCCFKCLRQGHGAKDCLKRVVFAQCNKRNHHHRSLCPQKLGTTANEQANLAEEIEPEEIETDDEDPHTENSLISSGEMVLMQTARANINNQNNGLKENVRLLLNSGSQRTLSKNHWQKRWTSIWESMRRSASNIRLRHT